MIDLHSHVLPGIDDGPEDLDGAVALARAAARAGTRTLVATPHVSWRYPNTSAAIAEAAAQVGAALREDGVGVEIVAGAEVALTLAVELDDRELAALRLGSGPWLLVECPFTPGSAPIERALENLQRRGHRLVLAHPERCPALHGSLEVTARLVDAGMLTSVTAGAFAGQFGHAVRNAAQKLWEHGLVHNVASDAHDATHRSPEISAALERAGLQEALPWLAEQVPAAILRGGLIPTRAASAAPQAAHAGRLRRVRALAFRRER
jgi:protein-tyrosine phosphatase